MEPRVKLEQGTYKGRHYPPTPDRPKALDIYLGIPYALSTAGEDRFRPARPIPVDAGDGAKEFDAAALGLTSPYTDSSAEVVPSGEDCLSVNVVAPSSVRERAEKGEGKLPVVVYFHGGAFNMGYGIDRDMPSFVAHAGGIIAVSFNYRLGALGFLPSEAVVNEGGREALNLGLGDQRVAMKWVERNIGAFGGDVGRVGVMGISAGAHSVGFTPPFAEALCYGGLTRQIGHHLLNEPPFHKAILESGAPTSRAVLNPHHPRHEGHFAQLLSELGLDSSDTPLSKLRAVPLATLTRAAKNVWAANAEAVTWPFQPVIDGPGGSIPAPPLSLLKEGRGRGIPLITGFCTNEGSAFVPPMHSSAAFASFFKTLVPGLGAADLDALEALYPLEDFPGEPPVKGLGAHWRRTEAAYAHYAYIAPVLQTAMHLGRHAPVYVYEFAVRDAVMGMANHTDQTPYVTRLEGGLGYPGLREVARRMHGFFAGFLAGEAMEGWPAFVAPDAEGLGEEGQGKIMVFGKGNSELLGGEAGVAAEVRTLGGRELERVRFWWERTGLSQGMGDSLDP